MTRRTAKKTASNSREWQNNGNKNSPAAWNSSKTGFRYEQYPQDDGNVTLNIKNQFGQFLVGTVLSGSKVVDTYVDLVEKGDILP